MIDIKDIQGNVIYSTEINKGAKRKFQLMGEDYITLLFSLEEPVTFGLGSYVEIDGVRFEVTDLQKPVVNNTTGGYDYQLRLDAYYRKWKNKIFKFTPEVGGQEASWSLTASLDVHLGIFLRNLSALGYTYNGTSFTFSIDSTVEDKAVALTYENMSMIDALSAMAEAWSCEWWITDNIINFGRCEYGTAVDFVLGENVVEMTRTESQSSYATRLYVFGSTRNIPSSYRPVDESVVVNGVVQRRLMLPEGIPYIDAYSNMSEEEAIEEVVILDDVYPRTDGNVSSVSTYDDTTENEDGTSTTETFYRFTDSGITFSEEYILEGGELKAIFQSGSLNGMEFGISFNPEGKAEKNEDGSWNTEAQLFEIVANEDYGRKLPDSTLHPEVGDKYILIGWDSTKIASLGLVSDAEQELYQKGLEISAKRKIDPNTYPCKMFSDYMYGLDSEGNLDETYKKVFEVGDRVNLINSAYFENGRQSRIIGYEYNLDYPYDSPIYTVGESASYSRIGALESKLDALTLKGQTYTGGNGSGVYVIGTNDSTKPTNRNVYSALKSDQIFLRKDKDDRSKGKISTDKAIEVGKFVTGASGAIIQVDATTGQTIAEVDKLYVRMKAYFETLEIINVNSIGGKQILSPAGAVKCIGVEELDDAYRCYFLGEQDGEIIENRWVEGMQAYSQMFNAKEGVSNKVSNTYYWRLVTGVSEDVVNYNNQKCHYIDLSKTDCDTGSDIPKAGDVINHRGCRNDVDYMNFIEFSSVGTNAPYITLFQGVNSYSLTDKEYVSFGYDQSTGRAYMNVYGDMSFGNRDESSYIKYNPTDGVSIKGKLSVGTTYNGSELGSLFDKQQEDLESFAASVTKEFESIRNEMDGAIDTWFGEEIPTLDNYPASDWATNSDKDSHLGDLYYSNDGKAYRFQYTDTDGYYWAVIEDSEVAKALELAQKALDTADGKRRVFIVEPYPPYDLGDLWAAGEGQPLMRCINARESGSYYASDWALADDSHAYADAIKTELEQSIASTKSELDQAIADAEAAAKTYTDEAKAEVQASIDAVEQAKADLEAVYTKAQADEIITKAEADAINEANAVALAQRELLEARVNAYADGVADDAEKAAIAEAEAKVEAAKSELHASITATKNELDKSIADTEEAMQKYTDDAKTSLQASIDALEEAKANISDVYDKAMVDGFIDETEKYALDAAKAEAKAAQALAEETAAAYADNIVTEEEAARIKQAEENLAAAKAYAEEKANEAFDNAMEELAGYEYLKAALKEDTTVEGGLIQSSLIKLGYTGSSGYVVMAGSNGTLDSTLGDKSIAFWAGGDMLDRENGSTATNAADFLVRMDGSGYAAGGNLSWDVTGKITADPMSFFVGEDTVSALLKAFTITANSSNTPTLITPNAPFASLTSNGAVTLKSTLGVTGDLTASSKVILGDIPMYKSQDGVVYIEGNLVVQGGITMYGTGTTSVPSIIDSLPTASTSSKGIAYFDSNYFSVGSDGKVSFIGETGGLDTTELQNYLTSNSYLNVTEGDGRYLKLSNSGDILISNTAKGVINFSSSHADETGIRLYYNNTNKGGLWYSSDTMVQRGIHLYHKDSETSLGINNEGYPYYYVNGGERILLHSGNYSSYALSTTGGTLTSTNTAVLNINLEEGSDVGITYRISNNVKGRSGHHTTYGTYIYNSTAKTFFSVKDDGNIFYSKGTVWHSGNSTLTDANRLMSIYGTATSGSMDDRPTSANVYWTDKSIRYFLATSSMTEGKPDADSRIIHLAWDNTGWNAQLAIPGYNAGNIQWRAQGLNSDGKSWGNWITVLDSRNYSNYALPLTGGKLVGNSAETFLINRTGGGNPYVKFLSDGSALGYLGVSVSKVPVFADHAGNAYTIWHAGNDGSGSGLNADLLDGQEGSWYQKNVISFKRRGSTGTSEFDANIGVDAMMYNYASSSYWKNAPSVMLYGQIFTLHSGDTYALSGQLAWDINHNSTTDTTRGLWWRATDAGDWVEAKWHQIAFTDSNVASATKLQTARTIWGQSFDGTGNVDGTLRVVPTTGSYTEGIRIQSYSSWSILMLLGSDATATGTGTSTNSWGLFNNNGNFYINRSASSVNTGYELCNVNGNWGMGTNSPTVKLHVIGRVASVNSNADAGFDAYGSSYALFFGVGAGNTNRGIYDRTNSSWWMYRDDTLNTLFPQGNFGIGTTSPSYKLHVVGSAYLNGDAYVDDLNTYDILPRSTESYSCGYSGKRWYQVYSYIGNFSGAMTLGSTLSVTGATTMTNVTITGDLRLKDSTNYGRTIYFGDGAYCYLKEATDDVMTIYGGNGININTSSTSYKVSINTNLLVSGGITMYSARSLKNIMDESGLSLEQLSVIKPTRFTWKDGRDNRIHFGGIADDVKQVLPEVVYDSEGVLTMDYGNAAFAIASSLIKPVVDHERRIAMLEKENEELRNEVERLKSA